MSVAEAQTYEVTGEQEQCLPAIKDVGAQGFPTTIRRARGMEVFSMNLNLGVPPATSAALRGNRASQI
jgi:hypothetical protein